MKPVFCKIALLIVLLCLFQVVSGQRFPKKARYASVSIHAGSANYVGDLDPGNGLIAPAISCTRPTLGIGINQRLAPRMTARASLSWGRIKGSDAENSTTEGDDIYRYLRNLSFRNDITEFKTDVMIDLFANRRGLERRAHYTPYIFIGIAAYRHNPKALLNGEWISLQPIGTEGQFIDGVGRDNSYNRLQVSVPLGIGFRYKLSMKFDLAVEIGWRKTFTDYLDDVGGTYVNKYEFEEGSPGFLLSDRSPTPEQGLPEGTPGHIFFRETPEGQIYLNGYGDGVSARGDLGNRTDWYIFTAIHLSYIFHPKVVSPKFRG